jgi:N-acetylmuramoyl-L-alanine amidase
MKRIALSAGHRNADRGTSPGHPCELADARTGRVTAALATRLRALGFDVRVVQPLDGLAFFAGGIQAVGRQVVKWHNEGWRADLFVEIHFQGTSTGDRDRGSFVIYPDQRGELDVDTRDRLAPLVTAGIQRHTGVPRWRNGTMPESQTNVKTLGVFLALSPIKQSLTRALIEIASCSSPADRALMGQADFNEKAAHGIAEGIAAFFGVAIKAAPVTATKRAEAVVLPGGTVAVDHRFQAAWEQSGGLWQPQRLTPGHALEPAFEHDGLVYQRFERGMACLSAGGVAWLLDSEKELLEAVH